MIYVLIAGSYTPLCIKFMDPAKLPLFLGAMWTMAAAGILLKLLWLDAPRWLGTLLYLALGWAIVVDLPAFAAMPAGCLVLWPPAACATRWGRCSTCSNGPI